MKNRKTDEEISRELGELYDAIGLKTVRAGTDLKNFKILKMLPSNIKDIMEELCLTKVPVTIRVNILDEVGLVKWYKGTGNVVMTDFGAFFFEKIKTYEEIVRGHVVSIVKNCVE
jgi:predicted transcriptional regulator